MASNMITGKVALVTGSSAKGGIGIGIARSLASRGCDVMLTGTREHEKVEELVTGLRDEYGVSCHYFRVDFSALSEVEQLVKDIRQIYPNGIDILVNNAAEYVGAYNVDELDVSLWEKALRVNLTAPFYLTQMTLPDMKRKGWGRIINTSSVWGLSGVPLQAAYVVPKHGICGLTKTVALETLGSGVTCNAICPGRVRTELLVDNLKLTAEKKGLPFKEFELQGLLETNPSGQYVEVGQVGELTAFLCSSAADQMTGTCIPIDGGNRAK